jgi:hypothetical protein
MMTDMTVPDPDEADETRASKPEEAGALSPAEAALRRIRARAEAAKLGPFDWQEWKAYRDEGRR